MQRRNIILGAFALVGVGGWVLTNQMTSKTPGTSAIDPAGNLETMTSDIDTSVVTEMVLGNPDASVEVVEYASFTCPHCARFHEGPFKQLKQEYIDTGKIRFIYREVYFDRPGLWASMIARCGGKDKFFGISNLIYKDQAGWSRAGEPAAVIEELRKIGRLAGLDSDTLEACLQDGAQAETLVAWSRENGSRDNIDSTPSFLINGKKQPNMPYTDMKALIDAALGS